MIKFFECGTTALIDAEFFLGFHSCFMGYGTQKRRRFEVHDMLRRVGGAAAVDEKLCGNPEWGPGLAFGKRNWYCDVGNFMYTFIFKVGPPFSWHPAYVRWRACVPEALPKSFCLCFY